MSDDSARLKACLEKLRNVLMQNHEDDFAKSVDTALLGSNEDILRFLVSNEVWGGAGSIADQAGMTDGRRTDGTRAIQSALIALGEEQIRQGIVNVRTDMWTGAFRTWKRDGI
jgi:hypothetical protein